MSLVEFVNVNATDKDGWTALMRAACFGKFDCLEHLIAKRANLEATSKEGNTALMLAAQQGRLDCLKHLIDNGAELEATTEVSAAHSVACNPLHPSPSATSPLAAPAAPRLTAAAHCVWRRRHALPQAGYTALMLAAQLGIHSSASSTSSTRARILRPQTW